MGGTGTNTYKVVVVASDDAVGAAVDNGNDVRKKAYEKVTVMVTDVDEPGMITLSAQQPQVGVALTATLTDDDAEDANSSADGKQIEAKWMWEQSSAANGPWTPILTGTEAMYQPLGVADKYLRVTATYDDEHSSDKSESAVSANMARAEPAANNAAPVFPDEDTTSEGTIEVGRKVDENSPPGTNVGKPVVADDAVGDVLTYTLSDPSEPDLFVIDPATGQITVAPRATLDADEIASYTVMVTATDPWGATVDQRGVSLPQPVIITINDVNEDPVITAGDTKVTIAENANAAAQASAAPIYVAYPEAPGGPCAPATCTWSLKGADAGDFNIGNQAEGTPGQLTFKEDLNYEAPADANEDNKYMVTVVVTDAGIDGKGKLSAERDVVVTVTNVNEGMDATVVTLSSLAPKVGVPLTATLSDPDGGEKDIKWQWSITGANTDAVPGTPTITPNGDIDGAKSATYTPKVNDVGGILTAMVTYADAVGSDRTGMKAAANGVVQGSGGQSPCIQAEAHEPVGAGELRRKRHVRSRRRPSDLPECACCGHSYGRQRRRPDLHVGWPGHGVVPTRP